MARKAKSQGKRGPGTVADPYLKLIDIGIALSAERNHDRLMEMILLEAKSLCNADGGTLYLRTAEDTLKFEIMHNDSLDIAMGGTNGKDIDFAALRMYDAKSNEPNHKNVATHVALTGESVNVSDAYKTTRFDFSGTKKFDKGTGFRSKSFFTAPMKNHDGDVIGVLQLLNAQDPETGKIVHFSPSLEPLVEAPPSPSITST